MKKLILILIVNCARVALLAPLLNPSTRDCFAQWITWDKTYLYSAYTNGYSVKQTSDGNYIICGVRGSNGGYVAKLDSFGDTLWVRYFPVSEMYSIVEANDGNYVAIGYAYNLYIVKISPSGNTVWARLIPESGYEIFPYHINKTTDNNFIVAGKVETSNPTTLSAYYIKIDNNGNKIWSKIIGPQTGNKSLVHAKPLIDSGFILTGGLTIVNNIQIYLVRTNSNGDTLWTNSYGSDFMDIGHSVIQTDDKGFLVLGNIWYSNQNIKLYFCKTDSLGNLIWSKVYGDTTQVHYLRYGNNFAKLNFNNTYIITGYNTEYPMHEFDTAKVFLLNIDSSGNKIWEKFYKKDTLDVGGVSIDVCNDSGFVISGHAKKLHTAGDSKFLYVFKTNKNGEIIPIGINIGNNKIPDKFKLHKSYPNPFNPVSITEYEVAKLSIITIKIYNILGKEIKTLTNKVHKPGIYSVTFDGTYIPSGIYFVSFTNNVDHYESQKIILIK